MPADPTARPRPRPPPSRGIRALLSVCALVLAVCGRPPPARAQNPAQGFERELLYTRTGVPAGQATLRRVVATYSTAPAPTLTLAPPTDIAAPPGADGLCLAPGGEVLVAGGANAPNTVHKVRLSDGQYETASPGAGSPIATQLALDPAGDRVWAACAAAWGGGRLARLPLGPLGPGVAQAITGADTSVAHLCFAHGRVYYVCTGSGPNAGALGVIDLTTLSTTRLISGLDRPRAVTFDPFTGHLLAFGATTIDQVDARPGIQPAIVSSASLAGLLPSIDLRSGTTDGLGRALALSATGHLVLLDYHATRAVGHGANPRLAAVLEAPGTLGSLAPLVGAGALRSAGCLWDNGAFDQRDGLSSRNAAWLGDTRTADDFYLLPGSVHRIDSIAATMFSDTLVLTAQVEVYDDCDGAPGALIGTFPATVSDTGGVFFGLRVLAVTAPTPGLWLRGGRSYWVSPVGIGNLQGTDQWYWGTTGAPSPDDPPGTPLRVRGRPGMFRAPTQGIPDWTSSNEAGCGCTDFAFSVLGASCKVLHDNGPPAIAAEAAGVPSIISSTNSDARAADNFRIPPCAELGGERVCFIEATVYTNCTPVRGLAEVFDNDCALPFGPALFAAGFSRVIDLGYSVTLGGMSLAAYTVQLHDLDWFLPDGRNYWLSVAVQGSGAFSQRAYFAANAARCADPPQCAIRISQSAAKGGGAGGGGSPDWTLVENLLQEPRDLSFLVAVAEPQVLGAPSMVTPPPSCVADADGSGQVDVTDIFHFLSNWFAGCP